MIHSHDRVFTNKENPCIAYDTRVLLGEPGGIRTHDLLIRSQTLYPAELRAHRLIDIVKNSFVIIAGDRKKSNRLVTNFKNV